MSIPSNETGLRYAVETSLKVVSGSAVWYPAEPNSYGDFGGDIKTVSRNLLKADRQKEKGAKVDEDATANFQQDVTQDNLRRFWPGFLFAAFSEKRGDTSDQATPAGELESVSSTAYVLGEGADDYAAGDLVFAEGFATAANNGLKLVTGITSTTDVEVAGLAVEASPLPAAARIRKVGIQAGADDLGVTGATKTITSTVLDFTELGLIAGEWIYVGGDGASQDFANAGNNGFMRVGAAPAENALVIDKSAGTMVNETLSGGETVRIFFGDRIRNEPDEDDIVRTSYQFERSLQDAGYEYLLGSVPNSLAFNFPIADKVTVDMGFVAMDTEQVETGSRKTGTFPTLEATEIFNTTDDFARLQLDDADEAALFTYVTDLKLTVSNGVTPVKALANLGAIDANTGDFSVTGEVAAIFSDIAAIQAIQNNSSFGIQVALVKSNRGFVMDLPHITLGGGKPNIVKDQPIIIPLTSEAVKHTDLGHTMLVTDFRYLPTVAG